jgi:hypothetical protein
MPSSWHPISLTSAELVDCKSLLRGSLIDVETKSRHYRIECLGGNAIRIAGHPEYCPNPVPAQLHGSVDSSQRSFTMRVSRSSLATMTAFTLPSSTIASSLVTPGRFRLLGRFAEQWSSIPPGARMMCPSRLLAFDCRQHVLPVVDAAYGLQELFREILQQMSLSAGLPRAQKHRRCRWSAR